MTDHVCADTDGAFVVCIDGEIWGPCEYAGCNGPCRAYYPCECPCHREVS